VPPEDSAAAMRRDFAQNLRLACGHEPSVSELCRHLSINRSQFNRYLSAAARPSAFVLNRLCDHFGVEAAEFHLPPERFARLVSLRRRQPPARPAYASVMEPLRAASLPAALRGYLGYWRVTYVSMSFPGMLVRALSHLFAGPGGDVHHRRIERLPAPGGGTFKCRYAGAAFYLEDRIFLLDVETLTKNEVTRIALYPSRRSRLTLLTGLVAGVSAGDGRRIAASRIAFEFLGREVDARAELARCALVPPDSPLVPPAVRDAVDNRRERGEPLFHPLAL